MSLNYFKKITAGLLLGFLFLINVVPINFIYAADCSTLSSSSCIADSTCTWCTGAEKCIPKGNICENIPPSTSQPTTVTSTDLGDNQCLTVGYSISKDKNCAANETKLPCPTDPNGYRCITNSNALQQTDLSKIGKVTTTYKAKVEIPCNTNIAGGTCPKDWQSSISSYITRLYQFGLMISGLVALGVIIYGAVLYTLSAGNVTSKEDGKDWMKGAIYGLALLFGAYLILYTINPDLVKLSNPEISPVILKDYQPQQIYISGTTTSNNTVNPSTGSSIPGCEISSSGALGTLNDFVTFDVNGQQVASSGSAASFQCQKCLEGNDLKDGKCNCTAGLTRRFTGACCPSNSVIVFGNCVACNSGTDFANLKNLSDNEKTEINKVCGLSIK